MESEDLTNMTPDEADAWWANRVVEYPEDIDLCNALWALEDARREVRRAEIRVDAARVVRDRRSTYRRQLEIARGVRRAAWEG